MTDKARILVVDDDPLTCRMVEFLLESEGYAVQAIDQAAPALRAIEEDAPDLILLDVQLPGTDGFTFLREVKRRYSRMPVIMLTARADIPDRLSGFQSGADDYVIKPFEPAELIARIRAVLRRAKQQVEALMEGVLEVNGLTLDLRALTVTLGDGAEVSLTPTEVRILHKLMANPNRVISRDQLTQYAVGYVADTSDNHIDVYIGRLRRKLSDRAAEPRYIVTVRGTGYKFMAPSDRGLSAARR